MADENARIYKEIMSAFENRIAIDNQIKAMMKKAEEGKATYADAWKYSDRISKHLSEALKLTVKPSNLPDGTLYWNIADRAVRNAINKACELCIDYTYKVQNGMYEKEGIKIKAQKAKVNADRIDSFLNKLVRVWGDLDA